MKNALNAFDAFVLDPTEESFAQLYAVIARQLTAFFRARHCRWDDAEDLVQDVMLKVYCKFPQIRDREAFRGWLYKLAGNALCDYYKTKNREIATVTLEDHQMATRSMPAGGIAFEFSRWMTFLDAPDREIMELRFLEDWEYHEIADATKLPIGTVQWRVFNAKKKLAPYLAERKEHCRRAA